MAFPAHSEEMDVEPGRRLTLRSGMQDLRVRCGGHLGVASVWSVGCGHSEHPIRVDIDVIEQRLRGLDLVAFGITRGQEAFVAEVDVDVAPVDRSGVLT